MCTTLPESCRLAKVPDEGEPSVGDPAVDSGVMGPAACRALRCGVTVLSMPASSRCAVSLVNVLTGFGARDACSRAKELLPADGFALAAAQRRSSCVSVSMDIFIMPLPFESFKQTSSHCSASFSAVRLWVRQSCCNRRISDESVTSGKCFPISSSPEVSIGAGDPASCGAGARALIEAMCECRELTLAPHALCAEREGGTALCLSYALHFLVIPPISLRVLPGRSAVLAAGVKAAEHKGPSNYRTSVGLLMLILGLAGVPAFTRAEC